MATTKPLTPTQDLILEVLAARYRLGEAVWTFDKRHRAVLQQLVTRKLVVLMHGITNDTVRAGLTKLGVGRYIDENYVPPIIKEIERALNMET